MKNYIYSYKHILKALIRYLSLVTTKSKVINPLYIGTRLNCANFEDVIIEYVDCRKILKQAGLPINRLYILLGTLDDYTQEQMAKVWGCSQQNISYHKKRLIRKLRRVQAYDKK